MGKGYSRAVATGDIFLRFSPESLQQEWEQLNICAWVWFWSVVTFFTVPIAHPQLSWSSHLLTSVCLQDKLMFPAWFKLTSSEKPFPVSWCYIFKAWIYHGLLFVRKKKRGARYRLNGLWSKFSFLNVCFQNKYTPAPSWRRAFSLMS